MIWISIVPEKYWLHRPNKIPGRRYTEQLSEASGRSIQEDILCLRNKQAVGFYFPTRMPVFWLLVILKGRVPAEYIEGLPFLARRPEQGVMKQGSSLSLVHCKGEQAQTQQFSLLISISGGLKSDSRTRPLRVYLPIPRQAQTSKGHHLSYHKYGGGRSWGLPHSAG